MKSSNSRGLTERKEKKNVCRSNSNEDRKYEIDQMVTPDCTEIEIGKLGSKTFEILADNVATQTSVGVCCMEKKLNSKPM